MSMDKAIEQAKIALENNQLPVGAALEIGGEFIDAIHNTNYASNNTFCHHAETDLLRKHSALLKQSYLDKTKPVVLYSTLEPCLMCFGTAVLHRVTKIVYCAKDVHGGVTSLSNSSITDWYKRHWPVIEHDHIHEKEILNLLIDFMEDKPRLSSVKSHHKIRLTEIQ